MQYLRWGWNQQLLNLKSSNIPLSHCAPCSDLSAIFLSLGDALFVLNGDPDSVLGVCYSIPCVGENHELPGAVTQIPAKEDVPLVPWVSDKFVNFLLSSRNTYLLLEMLPLLHKFFAPDRLASEEDLLCKTSVGILESHKSIWAVILIMRISFKNIIVR